ncbi:hypothetical protein ABZY03_32400 [Streptomyces klenkii]|uniref:hypothetical protein n=1 Tax=Streptomyces klenkii TaxID=1420899 RepID=UPI0033B4A0B4
MRKPIALIAPLMAALGLSIFATIPAHAAEKIESINSVTVTDRGDATVNITYTCNDGSIMSLNIEEKTSSGTAIGKENFSQNSIDKLICTGLRQTGNFTLATDTTPFEANRQGTAGASLIGVNGLTIEDSFEGRTLVFG